MKLSSGDQDLIVVHSFVDRVLYLDETASTNDVALRLAQTEAESGNLLVWTDCQTGGRGRGNNRWLADAGSVTFSLYLPNPGLEGQAISQLSLICALAVADALTPHVVPQLKWPNDIYVSNRKLCGILVERADRGLVVGVGLNVHNDVSQVDIPAIALHEVTRGEIDVVSLVIDLFRHLNTLHDLLRGDQLDLARAWNPRCWLRGKRVTIDGKETGICGGVQSDGGLRVGDSVVYGGVVTQVKRFE